MLPPSDLALWKVVNIHCGSEGFTAKWFPERKIIYSYISVLSSITCNRKAKGLSTYVAYIAFEKAFDHIDSKLPFHKLIGN